MRDDKFDDMPNCRCTAAPFTWPSQAKIEKACEALAAALKHQAKTILERAVGAALENVQAQRRDRPAVAGWWWARRRERPAPILGPWQVVYVATAIGYNADDGLGRCLVIYPPGAKPEDFDAWVGPIKPPEV